MMLILSRLTSSKWLWAAVLALGLALGTYGYIRHSTAVQVSTAVTAAEKDASLEAFRTKEVASEAAARIDSRADAKAERTEQEYTDVRNTVQAQPPEARQERAPAVLLDTVNALARLHAADAHGLPDAADRGL